MTIFKAMVKDKQTKEYKVIESEYNNKTSFITDLRSNGYSVNPSKVKESNLFNYIIENTNCTKYDWELKEIPVQEFNNNKIEEVEKVMNDNKEFIKDLMDDIEMIKADLQEDKNLLQKQSDEGYGVSRTLENKIEENTKLLEELEKQLKELTNKYN